MEFNVALLLVFLLLFAIYCSPRNPYYEKYNSGRAWIGSKPVWAPAIIPSRFVPIANK